MSHLSESITLEQLAEHNTLKSLWIAVHGHVYDLTTFSSDHPGGIEALSSSAGTDGTESYEYAGHSASNMAKMEHYRVGRLAGSLEQASPISHNALPAEKKRMRSATSRFTQLKFPSWTKLAVTLSAITLIVALCYQRRDIFVDDISSTLDLSQLQYRSISVQSIRDSFWAGIAIAFSLASYDTEEDEKIENKSPDSKAMCLKQDRL
ncbi:MAG: hypothetical protein L6R42_005064 [Xanthoria sp. 1 TBL-2021]|nr:MAG: hypothetical protein L6R42_005064 [Xanthoria sp. 1 TBL-2021]